MVHIWRPLRAMCGTLNAVPEGTETDFPFLRCPEDRRACLVFTHLVTWDIHPEAGGGAFFS